MTYGVAPAAVAPAGGVAVEVAGVVVVGEVVVVVVPSGFVVVAGGAGGAVEPYTYALTNSSAEIFGNESVSDIERHRVDVEEPSARVELAVVDRDEAAQAVEKVAEPVEVTVEQQVDAVCLVRAAGRCGGCDRLDQVELDPGRAREVAEREDDPRHVGPVGHRTSEPEEVGGLDRRRVQPLLDLGLPLVDLELHGVNLLLQLRGLRALRGDDHRVAGVAEDDQQERDSTELDLDVQLQRASSS